MAKVFLVEDDRVYSYVVQRVLERLGHSVAVYESSSKAWDAIQDHPVDLLLADLRFPQGQPNGVSLALHARITNPAIAIIFMTAHCDLHDKVDPDLGPILLKSASSEAFGDAIRKALDKKTGASETP